jgi:tetratricopeptide (TPR) repeat protein
MWTAIGALATVCLIVCSVIRLFFYDKWVRTWTYLLLYFGATRRALTLVRGQLDRLRRRHGDNHVETMQVRCTLGQIQYENGLRDEGRQNVALATAFFASYPGDKDPELCDRLTMLAEAQSAVEMHVETIATARRVLEIGHEQGGDKHPALSLSNLGVALMKADQPAEGAEVLQEALRKLESEQKPVSLHVEIVRVNLAEAQVRLERWTEAERLLRKALETLEPMGGQHLADAYDTYALLCERQEDWAGAERWRSAALAVWQKSMGAEHAEVVKQMEKLAEILNHQERATERDLYLKRAKAIRENLRCMVS